MFARGGGAWQSQAEFHDGQLTGDGADFCWDRPWAPAACQAPVTAAFPPAAAAERAAAHGVLGRPAPQALPPPVAQQQSRSGAAALSAQRAAAQQQQQFGGWSQAQSDPFTFDDTVHTAAGPMADGWRGRGSSFLLSSSRPATRPLHRPLPPSAPVPPPASTQLQAQRPRQPPPAWPKPAIAAAAASKPAAPAVTATAAAPTKAAGIAAGVGLTTTGTAAAANASGPPVSCSLSLDRYLEFWQLLTKGHGRVQQLSELEKSILKAADLKQIMLVNGLNVGSRPKKDVLDKLAAGGPMHVFSPLCLLPDHVDGSSASGGATAGGQSSSAGAAPAAAAASLSSAPPQLDAAALSSLGWVAPGALLAPDGAAQGAAITDSCCELPSVRICLHDAGRAGITAACIQPQDQGASNPDHGQDAPPPPLLQLSGQAQPANSDTTMASEHAAGCLRRAVHCSPGVVVQQVPQLLQAHPQAALHTDGAAQQPAPGSRPAAATAAVTAAAAMGPADVAGDWEEQQEEQGEEGLAAEVPEWLVQGVARVAETSQGSQEALSGQQLVGRRVAFVLLEDFTQGDAQGIQDTVEAGVLEGQVVEPVGVDHDDDCPPGCPQHHAFYYVRLRATRSTAPPARRAARRLDLVLDLQQAFRQPELDCLLCLGDEELQDAWVLLEPRQEPEPAAVEPVVAAGMQPEAGRGRLGTQLRAAGAATGAGGWRIKRSLQAALPAAPAASASKRQQMTAGCTGVNAAIQ